MMLMLMVVVVVVVVVVVLLLLGRDKGQRTTWRCALRPHAFCG